MVFTVSSYRVAVSVTCTFWLEAYDFEANICTVIMSLGALVQYHFCLRIYNRFKFDDDFHDDWDKPENERHIDEDLDVPDGRSGNDISMRNPSVSSRSESVASITSHGTVRVVDNGKNNIARKIIKPVIHKGENKLPKNSEATHNPMSESAAQSNGLDSTDATNSEKIITEGYCTFKSGKNSSFSSWERYYFVLSGASLWMYKDKHAFAKEPDCPIKSRPILLESYKPEILDSSKSYKILLVPAANDNSLSSWTLKFDTESEQEMWMEAFQESKRQISR